MSMPLTQVQRFKPGSSHYSTYRSGVSLHSHTMHSKERLTRLPTYIERFPIGGYIIERELGRLHLYHGWNFDFTNTIGPRRSPRANPTNWKAKPFRSASDCIRWFPFPTTTISKLGCNSGCSGRRRTCRSRLNGPRRLKKPSSTSVSTICPRQARARGWMR